MKQERLTEIKELLGKITQGYWWNETNENLIWVGETVGDWIKIASCRLCDVSNSNNNNNAEFIAQSPTIVRELIKEVERLKEYEKK